MFGILDQPGLCPFSDAALRLSYNVRGRRVNCGAQGPRSGFLQGLKTAIIEGHEIGGTCVNRGCVPSKALLAASGRVRDLKNEMHLKSLGIQVLFSFTCEAQHKSCMMNFLAQAGNLGELVSA